MEKQTGFNLNVALKNWRQELAAQPDFSNDDRRELEMHLHDSFSGLKACGLSEEESFWLASRRVGQPQQLAEEFVKTDPAIVWRERVFWMACGLFAFRMWGEISASGESFFPGAFARLSFVSIIFHEMVFYPPIIGLIIWLILGRTRNKNVAWNFLFRSRPMFVILATTLLLTFNFWAEYNSLSWPFFRKHPDMAQINWTLFFENLIQPCLLIILIAWLMPTQKRQTPKIT